MTRLRYEFHIYLGSANVAFDQLVGHNALTYKCTSKRVRPQVLPALVMALPEGTNRRNQPTAQEKEKTLLIYKQELIQTQVYGLIHPVIKIWRSVLAPCGTH